MVAIVFFLFVNVSKTRAVETVAQSNANRKKMKLEKNNIFLHRGNEKILT